MHVQLHQPTRTASARPATTWVCVEAAARVSFRRIMRDRAFRGDVGWSGDICRRADDLRRWTVIHFAPRRSAAADPQRRRRRDPGVGQGAGNAGAPRHLERPPPLPRLAAGQALERPRPGAWRRQPAPGADRHAPGARRGPELHPDRAELGRAESGAGLGAARAGARRTGTSPASRRSSARASTSPIPSSRTGSATSAPPPRSGWPALERPAPQPTPRPTPFRTTPDPPRVPCCWWRRRRSTARRCWRRRTCSPPISPPRWRGWAASTSSSSAPARRRRDGRSPAPADAGLPLRRAARCSRRS